jgi:CNT family concentrative nucleoside transporter
MGRFFGLIGIAVILGISYILSNNKKAINLRLVFSGLALQLGLALLILKVPLGQEIFKGLGNFITKLLNYSDLGARFVFGVLGNSAKMANTFGIENSVIIFVKITASIIFMSVLISIGYYAGIVQRLISIIARVVYKIMGASGSEALSNVSSAFVGQVEAQIMIKPYLEGMTNSELLASMAGSMACVAGGVMAIYISFGIPAEYLIAASIMAAPGALVISKIVFPETEQSQTRGSIKLEVPKQHYNLIDAIATGAADGIRISLNVIAMLIAFIALIAMINAGLGFLGRHLSNYFTLNSIGIDLKHLSLNGIFGILFSGMAYIMGVPFKDIHIAGGLMGTKMVANEFIAYSDFASIMKSGQVSQKTITIVSIALCGFANFGSIGMQVGGIGQLAPGRRHDLARLGMKAMICGTLASYLSATIAGILM